MAHLTDSVEHMCMKHSCKQFVNLLHSSTIPGDAIIHHYQFLHANY